MVNTIEPDQLMRIAYLVLLGTAVLGWLVIQNRGRLGDILQQAALWALIFLGAIGGYGLWEDIRADVVPRQAVIAAEKRIELPRARDGHYYIVLDVNGTPVRFVVDTGASHMVLTRQDARRVGITPDDLIYLSKANTANGTVRTAQVRLDEIAAGPIVDHDVQAWVNAGEMEDSLLGMSYLNRFDRIEISGGQLVLTR